MHHPRGIFKGVPRLFRVIMSIWNMYISYADGDFYEAYDLKYIPSNKEDSIKKVPTVDYSDFE